MKNGKIRDNLITYLKGKGALGSVDLNNLGNLALFRLSRDIAFGEKRELPHLNAKQKRELKEMWSPYFMFVPTKYHRLYLKVTGEFHAEYIPEDIMFMYIDRFYSDRDSSKYFDNKCYYYQYFKGINMPKLIAMKKGGCWLDDGMHIIDRATVLTRIKAEDEVVIKIAVASECGKGVTFVKSDEADISLIEKLSNECSDVVIQKTLKQHPFMAKFNETSVNTLRIISLIKDGEVKVVFSGALRYGTGGARVDNVSSGGAVLMVDSEGTLNGRAVRNVFDKADSVGGYGSDFAGLKVPGYQDAIKLVKRAHSMIADYRMVHWDIAIDEAGCAVLIEANLSLGSVLYFQNLGTPLFGDITADVLSEVFAKRRRLTVLV